MSDLLNQIEKAFDYRGDVTLDLKDGTNVVGYLFNREPKGTPRCPEPFVEIYPTGKPTPVLIKYSEIAAVRFTGEDAAAGKSWEAWVAKQAAKKTTAKNNGTGP
jgi:hypothetical protein